MKSTSLTGYDSRTHTLHDVTPHQIEPVIGNANKDATHSVNWCTLNLNEAHVAPMTVVGRNKVGLLHTAHAPNTMQYSVVPRKARMA